MALGAALRRQLRASQPSTLTAAVGPTAYAGADQIANSRVAVGMQNRRAQAWQEDAWAFFDTIGPAKYAARYVGNAFARLRFVAGVVDEDGDNPVPISAVLEAIDDPEDHDGENGNTTGVPEALLRQAQVELGRIRSAVDGQAGILRDYGLNLTVAGDCNLVGIPATKGTAWTQETWDVYSVTQLVELDRKPDGTRRWAIRADGAAQDVELPPNTVVQRIYQPHPKRKELADAPFRGILDDLEELALLKRAVRSIARSRVGTSGVLLLPTELDIAVRGALADQDPNAVSRLVADLVKHMTTPLADEGSAANVVPHILEGPADVLDKVKHVPFLRPLEEVFIKLREEKLRDIAIGLDIPPETLLGTKDVNHWGSATIAEEAYKAHIEPLALLAAAQMAAALLRPALAAPDAPNTPPAERRPTWDAALVDRIVIVVDGSRLVDRPDKAADALNLHKEMVLSDEALRRYTDFTESDAPSPEELADRIERERLVHARGATAEQIPPSDVDPRVPNAPNNGQVPAPPAATVPTQPAPRGPAAAAPRTASLTAAAPRPIGARLTALDLALQARVTGAAEQAVRRALERVGARITSKAAKDRAISATIAQVPKHLVAATLGRAVVASLSVDEAEWLHDDLEAVATSVDGDVEQTRRKARAMLVGWLGQHNRTPSAAQLAELDQIEQRNASRGHEVLVKSLTGYASKLLYQLDAEPDTAGEGVDAGRMPPGIVRTALAAYGGQDVTEQADGSYRVDPTDQPSGFASDAARQLAEADDNVEETGPGSGIGPMRGVAGGVALLDFTATQAPLVEVWRWEVGAPANPFEEHQALEGHAFSEAPVNTTATWTGFNGFFPGDHQGCACSLALELSIGDDLAA